jgi:hypothetical protein
MHPEQTLGCILFFKPEEFIEQSYILAFNKSGIIIGNMLYIV